MRKTTRRKADTIAGGTGRLNEPISGKLWLQSRSTQNEGTPMTDNLTSGVLDGTFGGRL